MRARIPVLRMYDVAATKRFYVDYLGFDLDWQETPATEHQEPPSSSKWMTLWGSTASYTRRTTRT
jgi:catechol 2,3-dioxygenase-like lactoylglutathione lyase family enzyme